MVEYNNEGKFNGIVQTGVSNQSYQREDYFDQPDNPNFRCTQSVGGYVKGELVTSTSMKK